MTDTQTVPSPNRPGEALAFKVNPLLPLPTPEQMAEDMKTPKGREELQKFLNARADRLRQAEADPLQHGLRLHDSRIVDGLLEKYQKVYESGGKRAGKTHDGVPRFLRCCFAYGNAVRWAMQDNDTSSVENLQRLVWSYLPPSVQKLNMKGARTAGVKYRVHYKSDTGFDKLLILPNECRIYFLNYSQKPEDFLGWELGKAMTMALQPGVPDIGALLDENCPLAWFENIELRCSTRGAKIHWMYSPQDGITPAIKQLKANAKTIESAPAELLSERVNVPGLPKGHMPLIQVDETKRLAIFYRFTEKNPLSGYANPGGVRELCQGKNDLAYTMSHAYGYCEAVRGRALPLFGEWNIIPHRQVPGTGTNWKVTDPGGAKNWATLWLRATPGESADKPNVYIYREWPDYATYGDWAKTSANPKRLNGEPGPAQPTIGYGPEEYVKLFDRLEKIIVPMRIQELVTAGVGRAEEEPLDAASPAWGEIETILGRIEDAHHVRRIRAAIAAGDNLSKMFEDIFENLIDPRAGKSQNATEGHFQDLISKLLTAQSTRAMLGERPGVLHPFIAAPGLPLRDGISAINELLYFDANQDRVSVINSPRLFVSENCRNFIWAANNYCLPTDEMTSDDACEDFIDDLRYGVTRGLRYVQPGGKVKTRGGGAY